jgi:hypothetical protein
MPLDGYICPGARLKQALLNFIEHRPKVTGKQIEDWADRIMSEIEIVGYVPEWILRDIFETVGLEIIDE